MLLVEINKSLSVKWSNIR